LVVAVSGLTLFKYLPDEEETSPGLTKYEMHVVLSVETSDDVIG
jgi:hypothetical protein